MKNTLMLLYDYVLPNGVVPNALLTEFGLLYYLNSLHSKGTDSNIFEKEHGLGDQGLGAMMYESSLGSHMNSLSGCHLLNYASLYGNRYPIKLTSLLEGRQSHSKYIYPIRVSPHIDNFTGITTTGSKIIGEYFWKHMSSIALKDAQEGRALILLDYAQENNISKGTFEKLHEALRLSGIPKNQVLLIMNSLNAKEIYESWFPEEERRMILMNFAYVMNTSSFHFYINNDSKIHIDEFFKSREVEREHHYIFKIRRPRNHRIALLLKMQSEELLEKADWSCLQHIDINQSEMEFISNTYDLNLNFEKCRNLKLPHTLKNEIGTTYSNVSAWTDRDISAHKNSYLYVCTETYIDVPYKFFTEKVFKPIANFQPFLFASFPGALKVLRELGFKTFSPFINEEYDDELNPAIRMNLICKELMRICSMSKKEIHDWYWSMANILVHNHFHLLSMWKTEPTGIQLLDYVYNRCYDNGE